MRIKDKNNNLILSGLLDCEHRQPKAGMQVELNLYRHLNVELLNEMGEGAGLRGWEHQFNREVGC